MPLQRLPLLTCLVGFIVLGATGCVVQRTVKDGDEVIAQGYVIKAPIVAQ